MLIVYRSTGRENAKPRPPWYSKLTCLASFARAVEACEPRPEVVFWNDGEIAPDVLALMHATGEVTQAARSGGAGSYLSAVDLALGRLAAGDLVYLAEDDYLFRPEAFSELAAAAREVVRADYLSLYGSPEGMRGDAFPAGSTIWFTSPATTLSFAVRAGALRRDRRIHELALRGGHTVDTELCLAYRGEQPYGWRRLVGEAVFGLRGQDLARVHRLKRAAARAWLNGIAWSRAFRPATLVVSGPCLATHAELPHLAPDVDWEALAAETEAWAAARGARPAA